MWGEAERFWEARYRGRDLVWSGRANQVLVDVATPLPAGSALDLGCGEGGDAIWLAGRGWQVTAVDVSATALTRAADRAAAAGVADRIDFRRHDLAETVPTGTFTLVTAQYLHTPLRFPRDRVLRDAAGSVAPGGLLLIVDHAAPPPWADNHDHRPHLPTPSETLAALDLDPGQWRTERLETRQRRATGPQGQSGLVTDAIIAVRRDAGPARAPGA